MNARVPRALLAATLLSGMAALVDETIWARSLAIIFGSTVQANAAVFAAFFVGLSGGAWIFGRSATRLAATGTAYALTEAGIGLTALVVGLALHRYRIELTTVVGFGGAGRLAASFAVVLAFVAVPTTLMGATFPLVFEFARRTTGDASRLYGLYATNTLGAAAGTLLAGLVMLPSLGVVRSLALACTFNVAAALLAWPLRAEGAVPERAIPARAPDDPRDSPPQPALLLAATVSGAVTLSLEVLWSRISSYFLGNRTLAFSVLLAWVLFWLATASWAAGWLARRCRIDTAFLGRLFAGSAAAIVAGAAAASWWIGSQGSLEPLFPGAAGGILFYRVVETGLLVSPLLVIGCMFPLCVLRAQAALAGRDVRRAAGSCYAANTVGAVMGSLVTGSFGVRHGTFVTMSAVVLLCAVAAVATSAVGPRAGWRRRAPAIGVALLVVSSLPLSMPLLLTWVPPGTEPVYRREDEYGVFQVVRRSDGTLSALNNRTELVYRLGAFETSYVQEMQGHLGIVFCPDARRAVVLGSGYGITAGALALYPNLDRVDAVEILPSMVDAAALFRARNFDYQDNPRVHVVVDDGRHYLARSTEPFDIVSINVSDPHQPGGSSLFHADFYDVVKRHLTAQGVVVQHAFGRDIGMVLATLRQAFPYLAFSRAYGNGYNVVAALHPLAVDRLKVASLLATPAVAKSLRELGLLPPVDPLSVLSQSVPLSPKELENVDRSPIATDDRPRLEFSFSGPPLAWLFSNE